MNQIKWAAGIALVLGLLLAGYLFGVHTSAPVAEVITPQVAQSQSDGSVIAAREPAAGKVGKAPHKIPSGATEERRAKIVIKPSKPPIIAADGTLECPPVAVDLSLVRQGDGRRVIASSQDGQVISAVDIPIEAALMPISRPWAAGVSYGSARTQGVWVDRDLGRIRVGAEAIRETAGEIQARVRVGWSW